MLFKINLLNIFEILHPIFVSSIIMLHHIGTVNISVSIVTVKSFSLAKTDYIIEEMGFDIHMCLTTVTGYAV